MNDKKYFEFCIYTMREKNELEYIYNNNGEGNFIENKNWKTGLSLFNSSKKNKNKMLILFSAADENSGIIFTAELNSINVINSKTEYSFKNLRKIDNPKKLSNLILKESKKPLSDNYIRPYAVCYLPKEINSWVIKEGLLPIPKIRKTGDEKFKYNNKELSFLLNEFWQWSYSDLVTQTTFKN